MSPDKHQKPLPTTFQQNPILINQNYISHQLNAVRNERIAKYGSSKVPTPIRPALSAKSSPTNSYFHQAPYADQA